MTPSKYPPTQTAPLPESSAKTKPAAEAAGQTIHPLQRTNDQFEESSRRFSVGRSSSLLPSLEVSEVFEVRRKLGLPESFWSMTLCLFSIAARRALTSSNSDVVTTYCCLAGRILRISSCDFSIRSGVWGCVAKAFDSVPGFFFSMA